jgi:hypothetical protein|tara:strand:- start:734 stop:1177 length:444 start_codon:yes stop_codon:yes gene_type:complete
MISDKNIKLLQIPLILISLTLVICGLRWLIHDEPWILDQLANEERLNMSFNDLFGIQGNQTLSAYLTQIYRFLGLYVLGIGVLLISFSSRKMLEIIIVRKRILIVLGTLLVSNLILAYSWIPNSHFIYVIWISIAFYCVSLYAHKKY